MELREDLVKELTKDCKTQEDFNTLFKALKKRGLEAALAGELTEHLGYDKYGRSINRKSNSRNGYSKKTVTTSQGELELDIPRDREGELEPQLIKRYQTRFDGVDDKILSLYARGLSVRDIQAELSELYGDAVSTTLVSQVTNAVIDEVKAWQSRPLDELFPIVYLDCLVVKVREDKRIINKAVYLALGVNAEGQKELLGMWLSQNTLDEAEIALVSFAEKWDAKYPNISQSWQRDWEQITPFFKLSAGY